MAKIQIYARVRPTDGPFDGLQVSTGSNEDNNSINAQSNTLEDMITINTENKDEPPSKYSKAPGSKLQFRFSRVFGMQATQEEIFDTVARQMIDTFLDGYNGTIFAYGQTSSGKTHTIEGSGRKFIDRGLIPRTLSYIYKEIERRSSSEEEMTVHISYMEIYQDTGYDLLNPGMRPGALMVEVPKVQVAEGPGGEVRVRDLSLHLAATEEVAQSLLFQGSTCRKVAETSMNQCSSRSHTIFSIVLTAKSVHSEVITRSKLNLVDLAGSERVAKTGADGRILQEAKHINLSLHHLEHVIVTLQQYGRQQAAMSHSGSNTPPSRLSTGISEKHSRESLHNRRSYSSSRGSEKSPSQTGLSSRYTSSPSGLVRPASRPSTRRGHVPYRNCMLTMVLKDSLGGNCLTAMIATISAEEGNIHETISTCRFSQRVACISNRAKRNEELDDKVVIRKLKKKVAELEAEILSLKDHNQCPDNVPLSLSPERSSTFARSLSDTDRQRCHQILHDFFHGKIDNPVTAGIDSAAMFQECLIVLRSIVLHSLGIKQSSDSSQHTVVQNLSSQIGTYPNQVSPQTQAAPTSVASESSPNKSHQVINVSPRNKMGHVFMTPSPNSRISSGFGSLHDEEGSINYEPSCNQKSSQSKNSDSRSHYPERDPNLIAIEQRSHEDERKRRRRHKHHRRRSHDTASSERDINHTTTHMSPRNNQETARILRQDNDSNPPPPIGAWEVPLTSPTAGSMKPKDTSPGQLRAQYGESSLDNQSFRSPPQISVNVKMSSTDRIEGAGVEGDAMQSPPQVKVLSSRAEKPRQKLHSKQLELLRSKEEKQRLVSEVNLLNLKVLEEGTKDELSHIGEQLAVHHAQYTQLQRSGANHEHMCAEKIAEQQLRIKQARLHQKLVDVQYQLRMSGEGLMISAGAFGHGRTPHPISSKLSTTPGSTYVGSSVSPPGTSDHWKMPTPQVQNEILKHEVQQSKVQQQIERLRISQMEKQLELKEASTRRRILALKQQLQSGNKPPATAPAKQSMYTSATSHTNDAKAPIPMSKSDQTVSSSSVHNRTEMTVRPRDSPIQTLTSPSHKVRNALPKSTQGNNETRAAHVQQIGDSERTKLSAPTEISKAAPIPQDINHSNKLTPHTSKTDPPIKNEQETKLVDTKVVNQVPSSSAVTSPSPKTRRPKSRQKLTLPEEIKETEYMSALQRQKARVSRIRRCIVAATVIQRAWRDYTNKKS